MRQTDMPEGCNSPLTLYETQKADERMRRYFQGKLSQSLRICAANGIEIL